MSLSLTRKPSSPVDVLKSESVIGKLKSTSKTNQSPGASTSSMKEKNKEPKGGRQVTKNKLINFFLPNNKSLT